MSRGTNVIYYNLCLEKSILVLKKRHLKIFRIFEQFYVLKIVLEYMNYLNTLYN